ncbi:MAG: helix-turn-helix domain-containing protein [Caulobacteraceae bacterium]
MHGRALLARNLRRIRTAHGVPQERLAADAAVDRAYMSRIEREDANPTVDVLQRLADALGVSIQDLFEPSDPTEVGLRGLPPGRRKAS